MTTRSKLASYHKNLGSEENTLSQFFSYPGTYQKITCVIFHLCGNLGILLPYYTSRNEGTSASAHIMLAKELKKRKFGDVCRRQASVVVDQKMKYMYYMYI